MDYFNFKLGFKNFLITSEIGSQLTNTGIDNNISIDIFGNTEKLNSYVTNVLKINTNDQSLVIDELLTMNFSDGKFEDIANDKSNDTSDSNKKDNLLGFLNGLLSDKEVSKLIDTDGVDGISRDEVYAFLETVNVIEDQNDIDDIRTLSLNEIFNALYNMAMGNFSIANFADKVTTDDIFDEMNLMPDPFGSIKGLSFGAPSFDMSSYLQSGGASDAAYSKPKDITTMSKEELNTELSTVEESIKTKSEELDAINNNSDPEIKALKDSADKAYDAYNKKVSEFDNKKSQELNKYKNAYEISKNSVDLKQNELSKLDSDISGAQNNLDAANNTLKTFEEQLENLKSIDRSSYSADRLADLDKKISDLTIEVTKKVAAVGDAEKALNALKEQKQVKEKELADAKNLEEKAKTTLANFEEELAKLDPSIKQLQEQYKFANEAFESKKAEKSDALKNEIKELQTKANEIKLEISKRNTNEDVAKYSSVYYTPEMIAKLQTGGQKINIDNVNGQMVLRYNWARYDDVRPELNTALSKLEEYALSQGYIIARSDGERTVAESNAGRARKGNIVCKGGSSPHNYGCASDLVLFDKNTGRQVTFDKAPAIWQYAEKECGLTWGGNFKGKRGSQERHHFQLKNWKQYKTAENLMC